MLQIPVGILYMLEFQRERKKIGQDSGTKAHHKPSTQIIVMGNTQAALKMCQELAHNVAQAHYVF